MVKTDTKYRIAVYCTSNQEYSPNCIATLLTFQEKNPDFDYYIFGKSFQKNTVALTNKNNIHYIDIDLNHLFQHKWEYPRECFWKFYIPTVLYKLGYDFCISIEGDMYCNKTLNVDWSQINFIAGVSRGTVKDMAVIKDDYEKIRKVFKYSKHKHFDMQRIQSGLVIYHVKNTMDYYFFEKIHLIYTLSVKHDIPRKGDDSLLALFLALNPDFTPIYLPISWNYIFSKYRWSEIKKDATEYLKYRENLILNIKIAHFSHKKPWEKITNYPYFSIKYFYRKWRQCIYNHFSRQDIVKYFPKIDSEYSQSPFRVFWFRGHYPNFGDEITPYLIRRIANTIPESTDPMATKEKTLLTIGSILRLCGDNTIIWGSGIRDRYQDIKPALIIESVRGPLTRMRFHEIGCECPPIYGDPALLLPLFYKPKVNKKYDLGIIPHSSQYEKVKTIYTNDEKRKKVKVIDLRTDKIEDVIDQIVSCKKTVSSSLHGIIVSNAYDIPVKWIIFDDNIKGDNSKYLDHFTAISHEEKPINALRYKKIPVWYLKLAVKRYTINIDVESLIDTCPIKKGGFKNYIHYL